MSEPNYDSFGYALAMGVLQSDLYHKLEDRARAECDEMILRGQGRSQHSKSGGEIPDGWKLVPIEPTTDMWDQAENAMVIADVDEACGDYQPDAFEFPTKRIWLWVLGYRAAMKAAPAPQTEVHKPGAVCTDPECCYHGQRKASSCACSSAGTSEPTR